ncbi:hypothetical protein D3C85_1111820 [compost metagenome]
MFIRIACIDGMVAANCWVMDGGFTQKDCCQAIFVFIFRAWFRVEWANLDTSAASIAGIIVTGCNQKTIVVPVYAQRLAGAGLHTGTAADAKLILDNLG